MQTQLRSKQTASIGLHQGEILLPKSWARFWTGDQRNETRQEMQKKGAKKEEQTKNRLGRLQPTESLVKEELRKKLPSSGDRAKKQEVASEGVKRQVKKEETQTAEEVTSRLNVNQKKQQGSKGVISVDRNQQKDKSKSPSTSSSPGSTVAEDPQGQGPFFFFGGANGAEIVSRYCESKGWKRIYNKQREDFKLKWCETKSHSSYKNFKEGEQLMYQIPNNKVLTTKVGLLTSLREYERVSGKVKHSYGRRRLRIEEFFPKTFRMDVRDDREAFFTQCYGGEHWKMMPFASQKALIKSPGKHVVGMETIQQRAGLRHKQGKIPPQDLKPHEQSLSNKEGRMWICKPSELNQGKGIFLLTSDEDILTYRRKLQNAESEAGPKSHSFKIQAHIVQQYIQNPLLLNGKKFDVRAYLFIACTSPFVVFFRHGYVRLTCDLYNPSSKNLTAHLTNQYMQKKNPLYSVLKEDTVWSMDTLNQHVNDKFQAVRGLPRDWVLGGFAKRMQQIMTQCFLAVKSKLDRRLGFFDLIGCDFMIDDNFKVWLLEMNCNPALHTNCQALKDVIPSTVVEALDLTLEIFKKSRLKQRIFPLANMKEFLLLYDGVSATGLFLTPSNKWTGGGVIRKPQNKITETQRRQYNARQGSKNLTLESSNTSLKLSVVGDVLRISTSHPRTTTALSSHPDQASESLYLPDRRKIDSPHTVKKKVGKSRTVVVRCTPNHHRKTAGCTSGSKRQDKRGIASKSCSPVSNSSGAPASRADKKRGKKSQKGRKVPSAKEMKNVDG